MSTTIQINTDTLVSISSKFEQSGVNIQSAVNMLRQSNDWDSQLVRLAAWTFSGKDKIFNELVEIEKYLQQLRVTNENYAGLVKRSATMWLDLEKELANEKSVWDYIWSDIVRVFNANISLAPKVAGLLWKALFGEFDMRYRGTVKTESSAPVGVAIDFVPDNGITVIKKGSGN